MTDTPIRTFSTIVGDSTAMMRDLAAFLPADWEPGTPVLVIAGLPEGAELRRLCDVPEGWEWQNDAGNWHPAHRFGAENECTGYVVCRPKPEPDPPATDAPAALRELLDKGTYDEDSRIREWFCGAMEAYRHLLPEPEELVDPAATGDDEPLDDANAREHRERTQADTPAPRGRWITGDPLADGGTETSLSWITPVGYSLVIKPETLEQYGFQEGHAAEAFDALVDLVRRDGTAPTPEAVEVRDWLEANGKRADWGNAWLWDIDQVLAAVRALRDGET